MSWSKHLSLAFSTLLYHRSHCCTFTERPTLSLCEIDTSSHTANTVTHKLWETKEVSLCSVYQPEVMHRSKLQGVLPQRCLTRGHTTNMHICATPSTHSGKNKDCNLRQQWLVDAKVKSRETLAEQCCYSAKWRLFSLSR